MRLHPGRGAGCDADQREADIGDAAIGHQALDVGLADGAELLRSNIERSEIGSFDVAPVINSK